MKRVIVDLIPLLGKKTGVGRYAYENIIRMSQMREYNLKFVYWYGYLSDKIIGYEAQDSKDSFAIYLKKVIDRSSLLKRIARKVSSIYAQRQKETIYDLYWQPNFIPEPHIKSKLTVTTIHDLSFHLQPYWHPKERIEYFSSNFFANLDRSDHFITVSEYIKGEIVDILEIDEEKITVIYNGIDSKTYREYSLKESEETAQKYELPPKYILFVGSIEPRKNLINLLKAYIELPETLKSEYPLVLVGYKGWGNDEIHDMIERSKEHIKYTGYVDDLELAHIYSRASLFIYPSYYEGFGIPPIEAMSCGTPVIVSDRTSLPEVCGDAALYIEPDNPEDIKEKIELILNDESLQKQMIERGKQQSSRYSWEESAKEHMQLFKRLLSR